MVLHRYLLLAGLLFFIPVTYTQARDYVLKQALPSDHTGDVDQVVVTLYASAQGDVPLEVHTLANSQWRIEAAETEAPRLQGIVDSHLRLPLWAEVRVDGELLAGRSELNAPGDLTAAGEIASQSGFRFPDNSVQTSAADTQALGKVFGGASSCPSGSSIRAIDANGNVTCEIDDAGSAGVTQVATGAGLRGGPITDSGTISVATGGIEGSMIATGAVGTTQIDASQVQRRVSGSCPTGYLMTGINADGSLRCRGVHELAPYRFGAVTVDRTGDVGRDTSLALDANDRPVISYYDLTNGDLKLAHCNDANCYSSIINTVDNAGDVGRHTFLALDANGHSVISYYDATNGDLKLAHCNDVYCYSSTINTVDSVGVVGWYASTSLALDANGHPVISYYNFNNEDLKLAHCNDANCNTKTITTVDSAGNVGRDTSLALDANGYPVISYYDNSYHDLKLAHCNDASCNTRNITTLDGTGDVGTYTSLALDANGRPVVSYYDAANGDLKLAR